MTLAARMKGAVNFFTRVYVTICVVTLHVHNVCVAPQVSLSALTMMVRAAR